MTALTAGLWSSCQNPVPPPDHGLDEAERIQSALLVPPITSLVAVPFQPQVTTAGTPFPWTGRFVAIAPDPADDNTVIAGAESGGLWKSTDGGANWTHIDTFPLQRINDVRFGPVDPTLPPGQKLVFATAWGDTATPPRNGLWRSTDGGATWQKPATANPPVTPNCPAEGFIAGAVELAPDWATEKTVFLGNTCGLSISRDAGATWTHNVTFPLINGCFSVGSIVAHDAGVVDIIGAAGLQRSTDRGATFGPVSAGIGGGCAGPIKGLAGDASVLFAVTGAGLMESDDSGATFTNIVAPGVVGGVGRGLIHGVFADTGNQYTVYFGGVGMARATCTRNASGLDCPTAAASWTAVNTGHADQNAIAGLASNLTCAKYVANDGGLGVTTNCGSSFTLTGGGAGGLAALQIYEVTGQVHPDHTDLYFGTQDNDIWGSGDAGLTWPGRRGAEGFHLQVLHSTPSSTGSQVTGTTCFGCGNFLSDAILANQVAWKEPQTSITMPAVTGIIAPVILDQGVYVQWVTLTTGGFQLAITNDSSTTWSLVPGTQSVVGPFARHLFEVSGPRSNPTLWQPVARPDGTVGIIRITGVRSAMATITNADAGIKNLGFVAGGSATFVFKTGFGVDPNNTGRAWAADVGDNAVKFTLDGGNTWATDTALTNLVTAGGTLKMTETYFGGQVRSIAVDPSNSNFILVGTEAAGIIATKDRGNTWAKIPGSEKIPTIQSIFIDEVQKKVYVSSYGRGLWRIDTTPGPNQAPVANAGPDQTVECTGTTPFRGANVNLNGSASSDPDGDPLSFSWSAPGASFITVPTIAQPLARFPMGPTTASLTCSDSVLSSTDTVLITVVDTTKPVFTSMPGPITVTNCNPANLTKPTATDGCGTANVTTSITKIPLGTSTIPWVATDQAGNTATFNQQVTAILADDSSCCPAGTHLIEGGPNGDSLNGTAGSDCILGHGGQDAIFGNGGNDFISGGDGGDFITGGAGNDVIYGGPGSDNLNGDDGDDTIFGEADQDQISGGNGNDKVNGGPANDTLQGDAGNDICTAGGGTDTFALTCEVKN